MGHLLMRTALATTLGIGLHLGTLSPALAQGVPVVDTQNIAQNIQQLRQMIEDEILQNEQLTQLREQLAKLPETTLYGFYEVVLNEVSGDWKIKELTFTSIGSK